MLKKRIIPCLDIKNGRTVKGVNFGGLKDAGDPIELASLYTKEGADELVFLDITATLENRSTLVELVRSIAKEINIPFTVGGGVNSVETAEELISSGADKVAVNSAAIKNPSLINTISKRYGNQCMVVAIDAKLENGEWMVYSAGGTKATGIRVLDWVVEVEQLGAGEILLTSMDADGTKNGFDIELVNAVCDLVNIPVIASGGAGTIKDFKELFTKTRSTAGLAASIFHFKEIAIPELKDELRNEKIQVRCESILTKEMV